jgi:hypothetical protein
VNEQGIGDELLFSTCFPDIVAKAQQVYLLVEPRLRDLLQRTYPTTTVLSANLAAAEIMQRYPDIDYWSPAGDLPCYLRTRLEDFPQAFPPYVVDSTRQQQFAEYLTALGPGLKIGFSWRSKVDRSDRSKQYLTLIDWRKILQLPHVQFVNLQYDTQPEELDRFYQQTGLQVHAVPGLNLHDDLDGVAALISVLDGVVTGPNAVAGLAGVMAKQTWMCCRSPITMQLGTQKMPWYPSVQVVIPDADAREPIANMLAKVHEQLNQYINGASSNH